MWLIRWRCSEPYDWHYLVNLVTAFEDAEVAFPESFKLLLQRDKSRLNAAGIALGKAFLSIVSRLRGVKDG
jgi:hypothetical protein